VVVSGKVGIERKNKVTSTSVRLNTIEMRSYFGESTLFDNSRSTTTAIALEDTLTLHLSHEPLVALIHEDPELSLQLIKVLSRRIQETDEQVADLSRQRSRTMHKLYDKLD
jgi:CRP-like cAMP-binding protein